MFLSLTNFVGLGFVCLSISNKLTERPLFSFCKQKDDPVAVLLGSVTGCIMALQGERRRIVLQSGTAVTDERRPFERWAASIRQTISRRRVIDGGCLMDQKGVSTLLLPLVL
jgi:hypothetical protein